MLKQTRGLESLSDDEDEVKTKEDAEDDEKGGAASTQALVATVLKESRTELLTSGFTSAVREV